MFALFRPADEAKLQCWKCQDADANQRERSESTL